MPTPRLKPETVQEVERLTAEGVTPGKIARALGISRGAVWTIVNDQRKLTPRQADALDAGDPLRADNKERCPTCGAMVLLPCVACIVRKISQDAQGQPLTSADVEPLGFPVEVNAAILEAYRRLRTDTAQDKENTQ